MHLSPFLSAARGPHSQETGQRLQWPAVKESLPQSTLQGPSPHSALLVEELLLNILSYIAAPEFPVVTSKRNTPTNIADTAAWRAARLVCKQWNKILSPLIFRQWYFASWSNSKFTTQPSRAKRLWCNVATDDGYDEEQVARMVERWCGLVGFLREYCSAPQDQQPLAIRELSVHGKMDFSTHVLSLLEIPALGRALTLLDLRSPNNDVPMNVSALFRVANGQVGLPNLRHFILQRAVIEPLPELWDPGHEYDLTSLYLNECKASRTTVLALVNALAGSRLERLHLMDLKQPPGEQQWWEVPLVLAKDDVERLAAMFPRLTLFEMQLPENDNPLATVLAMRGVLPKTKTFLFGQWTACIQQGNRVRPSPPLPVYHRIDCLLTRLEISGASEIYPLNQVALDTFLRSEDARHLQELIVTTVEYEVGPPSSPILYGGHQPPMYWTCEDLRLLDMTFKRQDVHRTTEYSRQIYGFVASNCPQLCELRIKRMSLSMGLMSGLCFLSRLVHLEKLTLSGGYFQHWGAPGDMNSKESKKYDDPRWVVGEPSTMDKLRRVTSLQMCRKVATADDEMVSWMRVGRGKEMLWPSSPEEQVEEDMVEANKDKLGKKKKGKPHKPREGCCWTKMHTIQVEGFSEYYEAPMVFGCRLRLLLPGVRVNIHVEAQRRWRRHR